MSLAKLVWSDFFVGRIRWMLAGAAIALSVSLVVAVTSGYSSVEAAAMGYLTRFVGGTDAQITRPQSMSDRPVPESLVAELARDPDVHGVTGRLEVLSDARSDKTKPSEQGPIFHVIGIRRPQDSRVDELTLLSGQWFPTSNGNDAVLDEFAAERLKVAVGDSITLPSERGALHLLVVGIVHMPEILAEAVKSIYVPLETLQHFEQMDIPEPQVSRISIDFSTGVNPDEFASRWNARLAQIDAAEAKSKGTAIVPLELHLLSHEKDMLDVNMRSVRLLSYVGGAVSMLAATFIIFSSLSMGVAERQRTLAMLRAIGATRKQVASLIIREGLLLSILGSAAGIPLGYLWIQMLHLLFSDLLTAGVVVSWSGIALAAGGAILAALAASLLPAWSASRLSPLEAMNPYTQTAPGTPQWRWTLVGLALLAIDPAIFFVPWENLVARFDSPARADAVATLLRFYVHFAIGLESVFFGFFLISPVFVWAMEKTLAPILGKLLDLPDQLLRQQLAHGLWRAAGAASALMVGLAALVVLTVQSISMLDAWKLPDKFPDIFLFSLKFGGLDSDQIAQIGQIQGIQHFPDGRPELMPIAISIAGFGSNPLALVGAALAPNITGSMFFGIPPRTAMDMMELDFRDDDGNRVPRDQQAAFAKRAADEMELGRHVIVTEDYRRLHHAKYGDKITLMSGSTKYDYTICGIVWSPGLDVMVSMFDLGRQFDQRTAGMLFGSLHDAAQDFGADHVNFMAANLIEGEQKDKLLKDIKTQLGELNIRAGDVRTIKYNIDVAFRRLLALVSTVAFAAMGVASMGVTNTIMASIRSRRWQIGVLRSVGLTRGALLRLVLAEAILLGLIGMILGLACGAEMAIDARQFSAGVLGYLPPPVIPWGYIAIGSIAVMFVSAAAALWPAWSVANTEPLSLLQAGRAST
jgi:putative ABC transport system permease protein